MEISQLNIRGRMAYGIACLIAYMNYHKIDLQQYESEISILRQFTSATNLADWDTNAKKIIFGRFTDEVLRETIPNMFENLYWIGAGELYGQPSDCKESENILIHFVASLRENKITLPDLYDYSTNMLNNPISTDDYFGMPFICDKA